ncbi:ArsC/Spx/MgsR family protein [Falsihalocynthiibacter arcticus]|uniref:Arsenate reductase n=1 Tax=Falsihalocynthiibacter arcticus TaxID=1579316 RepID=A0A126UW54_9RHOB|nr:ArsC/Spx/MgsR family protein [Falsihalocynthiibacter arcticus]AML49965.1 arsenate reductase [Falsihalocynthiibacter arcticus]
MKIWTLKNCDTCRKAVKELEAEFGALERVDVRDDGVAPVDLARFYAAFGEDILNRRSTTWRALSPESREGNPLTLLAAHPTLMKRPVIQLDERLFLGWGKDVQAELMQSK